MTCDPAWQPLRKNMRNSRRAAVRDEGAAHDDAPPQTIREVQRRLRAQQGAFTPKARLPVVDQVVGTVLSQHTSDVNSGRAFARLKARFPDWEQVAHAPAEEIEDAIRCGGIARQKARRIKQILDAIAEREGCIDLSRLHGLSDQEAESYLTSLPGVGPKTAACVLAFSMGRPAFPVDTHVHRVVTRLGWVPANTTAEQAYRLLAPRVPAGIRYDLHLALVTHGRTVCLARQPRCCECVLLDLCPYGLATVACRCGNPPDRQAPSLAAAQAAKKEFPAAARTDRRNASSARSAAPADSQAMPRPRSAAAMHAAC
jgi:endonuclease-3